MQITFDLDIHRNNYANTTTINKTSLNVMCAFKLLVIIQLLFKIKHFSTESRPVRKQYPTT